MTQFLDFCREYGLYIVTGLGFIIEIVFIFVKRKPKSVDEFLSICSDIRNMIPDFIIRVESPGNGSEKLDKVLDMCFAAFEKKLGRKLSDFEFGTALALFRESIETILSTPIKKGVNYEK